jgi:hypothetical protein
VPFIGRFAELVDEQSKFSPSSGRQTAPISGN